LPWLPYEMSMALLKAKSPPIFAFGLPHRRSSSRMLARKQLPAA
jgi:hypothetical protein